MPMMAANTASTNQRERLWQIDFLARFRGQVTRQDLARRFGIALSNATRDFTLYRELAPDNLDYDHQAKVYRRSQRFQPLFTYDREHTLQTLTLGQATGLESCEQPILVDAAPILNQPNLDILSVLSCAVYAAMAVRIRYVSVSSGESEREIVPHSLVNSGLRWHVRAYCRTHTQFRDFVLTRITQAEVSNTAIELAVESIEQDDEWNRRVPVELAPHPAAKYKRAIELDYGLASGDTLRMNLRAATAGYLLRRWGVDCSLSAELSPNEYQLALMNPTAVAQQANLSIAPGFSQEINKQ
ncbi:helix-turn-helix transcriptional regulator [Marinobacterium litorale]|uniref:helix-turn-helix transcriptional regulator n=1 Tax=Marinobacterium litorale TaxID=404770 RepID=UPI000402886A|nr:WYL domain-containing protein [Marinobacterium litorale]